jgi:hypothetical protein
MAYKGGLGRGLDAIIPTSEEGRTGTDSVPIGNIIPTRGSRAPSWQKKACRN